MPLTRAGIVTLVPHDLRTTSPVALDDWGRAEEADTGRARRLAGSYAASFALVATVLVVGVVFGGRLKTPVLDDEVEVKFVPPEPVKVAPQPQPPPPPPAKKIAATSRPSLGSKRDAPPIEIPKGPPVEGDPNAPKEEGQPGDGDPNGCAGCTGKGGGAVTAPEPAPTAPPHPPSPPIVQISEVATPPVALAKAMPGYPEIARKQGIEAVVVVKFVIGEDGHVQAPKVLRGHPMFDDVVLAIVRTWTFAPATLDGKPVRMARVVKIPFRLKAS